MTPRAANGRAGVYGIIRFCPDPMTGEGVNEGVVLLCQPEPIIVRMSRSLARARRAFGPIDSVRLRLAMKGLERRIYAANIVSEEDLRHFASCEAGQVVVVGINKANVVGGVVTFADILFNRIVPAVRSRPNRT